MSATGLFLRSTLISMFGASVGALLGAIVFGSLSGMFGVSLAVCLTASGIGWILLCGPRKEPTIDGSLT